MSVTKQWMGTIDVHSIAYYGSQWDPSTVWLPIFFILVQ